MWLASRRQAKVKGLIFSDRALLLKMQTLTLHACKIFLKDNSLSSKAPCLMNDQALYFKV